MDLSKKEVETSHTGSPMSKLSLDPHGLEVDLFKSIQDVPTSWDQIGPVDIFIETAYLKTLESFPPKGMGFYYVLLKKAGKEIGKCVLQVHHFNAKESIRREKDKEKKSLSKRFGDSMKNLVAGQVDFHGLVCGNLLVTGEHGFLFDESIEVSEGQGIIRETIDLCIPEIEKQGKKMALVLVKDFFNENKSNSKPFLDNNYADFSVQPNMIFKLDPSWNDFEDYKAAMSSKYRVRCKRAFKKSAGIEKRELNAEQIQELTPRLYELYSSISDGAGFNLFKLNPDYFAALKRNLGADFKLIAYYKDEKIIAFFTTIKNGDDLEAHFLGFEHLANREMQLYLNVLYDIVEIALKLRSHEIVFSRTAIEIKSSVGAMPYDMFTMMTHRNRLVNKYLAPTLVEYLAPKEEYVLRKPFKEKNERSEL